MIFFFKFHIDICFKLTTKKKQVFDTNKSINKKLQEVINLLKIK